MKLISTVLGAVLLLLLAGGYITSTILQMTGQATEYIHRLDVSAIPLLSLGILIALVVFGFVPSSEDKA